MSASRGDELAGGRFVVIRAGFGSPILAEDRDSGGVVEVVEVSKGEAPLLRHRVSLEEMISRVRSLADPRLLPPRCANPLCIPHESSDPDPPRTAAALSDAALRLMACVELAVSKGIEVDPARAWIVAGEIRLPAPAPALYWRRWAVDGAEPQELLNRVWSWYRPRRVALAGDPGTDVLPHACSASSVKELAAYFVSSSSSPQSDPVLEEWARFEPPEPDVDRVIELAEERYRLVGKSEPAEGYGVPPVDLLLAAAYHHRACVAWAEGCAEEARADVARAIAIDPYPRYLTTAALFETGPEAAAWHDRAVAAVSGAAQGVSWMQLDHRAMIDAEDVARAFHARGVHRWRAGDREGAVADLRASLRFVADERVQALLARALAG